MTTPKSGTAQAASVRLARKTQSLDILYAVATSLGQPGTLEQVSDGFLDTFIELVDARAASVRLATGDGGTRLLASRGLAPENIDRYGLMPAADCPCSRAVADGRLHIERGGAPCAALRGRPLLEPACAEFVAVPAQYQDRILGVYNLCLDRPLGAMGEDMPELLVSVGRHLGLAMEKARLESEARRVAIMEERALIGNELHDSLAQSLIGMRLQVKLLGEYLARGEVSRAQYEARRLRRAVERANDDVRELLTNYRLKIGEGGLALALAELVERFRRDTGIALFFQNECAVLELSPMQEIQVLFIIQEALANIRRHSGARNARILLNNQDELYTVLIEDDGQGMVEDAAGTDTAEHAGLAIMRERTERLQGQIVIEGEPGEGTRIVLMFNAPQR